jgi:hypothetical protein
MYMAGECPVDNLVESSVCGKVLQSYSPEYGGGHLKKIINLLVCQGCVQCHSQLYDHSIYTQYGTFKSNKLHKTLRE